MIIDLSQLPEPEVIENLDFETIYQELLGDFREAMAGEWTAEVESDPVLKLLQLAAYRELLLRARINDAARAVMLAYASGADLDQIGAGFNVQRLLIRPAQPEAVPPVEAQYESDKSLRNRIQLAFEQLSVAGPRNAYIAHALGADGRVADASATSPAPCEVLISVLGVEGNGQAPEAVLQAVRLALNAEDVRPVADRVTVRSAGIVPYQVKAQLYLFPGPEAELIRAAAEASLRDYISAQRRLGRDIRRSALFATLHVEGVQRVELQEPAADVVLDETQAAYCTGYAITLGASMSSRLLPPNRSSLERSLGDVLPAELPVPLRELHDPARCEAALLPYLAWTRSVDRWDPDWSDEAKRNAVATSFVLHQRKGTLTALRQVVEPIGALSEVTEWWQRSPLGVPGTFEITVDVSDRGIDEGTVLELERLLDDVRPVSRHLTRLDLRITPVIRSRHGLAVTDGDTLEIFPWKQ